MKITPPSTNPATWTDEQCYGALPAFVRIVGFQRSIEVCQIALHLKDHAKVMALFPEHPANEGEARQILAYAVEAYLREARKFHEAQKITLN